MNKYVLVFAALFAVPALNAEGDKGAELAKEVIKSSMDLEKGCSSCSSCKPCSSSSSCCKSPEEIKEEEAKEEQNEGEESSTKCGCNKPKPKAEEE